VCGCYVGVVGLCVVGIGDVGVYKCVNVDGVGVIIVGVVMVLPLVMLLLLLSCMSLAL